MYGYQASEANHLSFRHANKAGQLNLVPYAD